MNWPALFLGCFVIGFVFSVLSLTASSLHLHFHLHVPFLHHTGVPHVHGGAPTDGISPFNVATFMAFLAWFGGTGYLLTTQFRWLVLPAFIGASLVGLAGSSFVFLIMARVLWSPRENMTLSDARVVGALGRVSQPIRPGRIGEVIYSSGGTRRSCGARSADGSSIDKGAEVVVTAYERGIASVRRWEDLAADKL
jgi:hypothetical protein